jgi:signal transduction histidine kinase
MSADMTLVDKALTGVNRLQGLLAELADISSIETGQFDVEPAPMSLTALVREVLAAGSLSGARVHIVTELPAEDLWIRGDRARLAQVVVSLVRNAAKFSPLHGTIRIALERAGDEAVLSVTDQGIGVPADQRQHLFERYFRGRNAPFTMFGGLGIGLYISQNIVQRHGGRLWFESAEGTGSTFRLALPALRGEARPRDIGLGGRGETRSADSARNGE